MFTRWTISNFKSIREPVTLDLAPLTVFSGINSSGKSSFIQSMLMVAQSFMSTVDDEALVLNGRFLQLGRLRDMLHYDYDSEPIEIGFDWLPIDALINSESLVIHVDTQIRKGVRRRVRGKRVDKHYPYVAQTTVAFAPVRLFKQSRETVPMQVLRVQATKETQLPGANYLSPDLREQVEQGVFNYTIVQPNESQLVQDSRLEQAQRVALANILPARLLVSIDSELNRVIDDAQWIISILDQVLDTSRPNPKSTRNLPLSPLLRDVFNRIELPETSVSGWERQQSMSDFRLAIVKGASTLSRRWVLRQLTGRFYSRDQMRNFRPLLAAGLSAYLSSRPSFSPQKNEISYEERLLPVKFMTPVHQVQKALGEQIFYLGPLRDEPRVIYAPPPLSRPWSVGLKGEYTAAMLDEYRNMKVDYPLPHDGEFRGRYATDRGPLIDAVTLWLQRMGLVESIDTEETPKVGYRLTVNSPGLKMALDLTSVGVGVSQVLPTLVLALLAPLDSTLIFEQPELHLHPKVQSVLGDFFLAISQMGKQCLVETHSEHLINRLRRRIVESEEDSVLPHLKIYFVEKEGAISRFREVKSNEFGAILEWPPGFFDEAENEASIILKKQMEKRRQAQERRAQSKERA